MRKNRLHFIHFLNQLRLLLPNLLPVLRLQAYAIDTSCNNTTAATATAATTTAATTTAAATTTTSSTAIDDVGDANATTLGVVILSRSTGVPGIDAVDATCRR